MTVVYEPHPVSKARKEELRSQGFTIIDAKFKPAGTPDEAADTVDPHKLNAGDLKAWLTAQGIEFAAKANKGALQALIPQEGQASGDPSGETDKAGGEPVDQDAESTEE